MANYGAVLFIALVPLFFLADFVSANELINPGECPSGWSGRRDSCYVFNETILNMQEAAQACQQKSAELLVIRNDAENIYIKVLMRKYPFEGVWLGLCFKDSDSYSRGWRESAPNGECSNQAQRRIEYLPTWNFRQNPVDDEYRCAKIKKEGAWTHANCYYSLPFVCKKSRSCQVGWYGSRCASPCHCAEGVTCHRATGICPHGCAKGWKGDTCSEANPEPEATFNCLRAPNGLVHVNVEVKAMKRTYRVVQAVSEEGDPLACTLPQVRLDDNVFSFTFRLQPAFSQAANMTNATSTSNATFPDEAGKDATAGSETNATSTLDNSDCLASAPSGGNVTWLIEFKEYEGLRTKDDVTVEVTCNIDDADSLEPENSFEDDSASQDQLTAALLSVQTSVYMTDAFTNQRQENFRLGQTLKLHVEIDGLLERTCGYPKKCVARPKTGDHSAYQLLDDKGCPLPESPVQQMKGSNGHFTSNSFPAFSLGSSAVVVDCQVEVKYSTSSTCRPDCDVSDVKRGFPSLREPMRRQTSSVQDPWPFNY